MSDESPWDSSQAGVTLTHKYGKGYEAPWAVFRGSVSEVRDLVLSFFGGEDNPELELSDLFVNLSTAASGAYAATSGLDGSVVSSGTRKRRGPGRERIEAAMSESDPAEQADPLAPLYAKVEAATSADYLKDLWADNQEAFTNADLLAAWKAKGKALKDAA